MQLIILWSLHNLIIISIILKNLLIRAHIHWVEETVIENDTEINTKYKYINFWSKYYDMIMWMNFHLGPWFGYYCIIFGLYFTDINLMNFLIMVSITALFGKSILLFLQRDSRFSGIHKMKKWWIFNRSFCIVLVTIRYFFIIINYNEIYKYLPFLNIIRSFLTTNDNSNFLGLLAGKNDVNIGTQL